MCSRRSRRPRVRHGCPSTNVVIGEGGDTQTVVITNTPKGGLVINKLDSVTHEPLEG